MKSAAVISLFIMLSACSPQEVFTSKATLVQSHSDDIIEASTLSHDGKYNLIADSKSVCLWQISKPKSPLHCLPSAESEFIEIVGISKNNQYFFTSNQVTVNLYSLLDGKRIADWQVADNIINDIAISADGETLLLGFRNGKASIIKTKENQIITFEIHRLDINSVSLSDNGAIAFTGSSDKSAIVWNTSTGAHLHNFKHRSRVNHVSMNNDGTLGFTLDAIKDRNFWNLNNGELIAELDTNLRFFEFNDSIFSADNSQLLTGSPKQVLQLWQVSDGALLAQWQSAIQRGRASVLSVAFTDKNQVLTTNSDGMLEQWNLPVATPQ